MMGRTADEVRAMSFYDWACLAAGFVEFNSTGDDSAPLPAPDADDLAALIDEPPVWLN